MVILSMASVGAAACGNPCGRVGIFQGLPSESSDIDVDGVGLKLSVIDAGVMIDIDDALLVEYSGVHGDSSADGIRGTGGTYAYGAVDGAWVRCAGIDERKALRF